MRVVSSREMRDLDQEASTKFKIPEVVLMENAGARSAEVIIKLHNQFGWSNEIVVFAGKGKNGGDALVTARHLVAEGKRVRLFLLNAFEDYQNESKRNLEILLQQKIRPLVVESVTQVEEYFNSASGPFFIVDGILGPEAELKYSSIWFLSLEFVT